MTSVAKPGLTSYIMLIGNATLGSIQAFAFLFQLSYSNKDQAISPPLKRCPHHNSFNQQRTDPCPSDGCKCTALLTPDALRALLTQSFQMQEIHYLCITDLKPRSKHVQPKVLTVFKQNNLLLQVKVNADVEYICSFLGWFIVRQLGNKNGNKCAFVVFKPFLDVGSFPNMSYSSSLSSAVGAECSPHAKSTKCQVICL